MWVRWDSRCVRIFNDRLEQVQIHIRLEPGKFSRILGVAGMSAPVLSSCRWWIERASLLGEACGQWARASFDRRGPEALRSIMGLCGLIKKHTAATIDAACQKALKAGVRRLKDIKRLIGEPGEQGNFAFAQNHPLSATLLPTPSSSALHNQPNHDYNTLKNMPDSLRSSRCCLARLSSASRWPKPIYFPHAQFLEIVLQYGIDVREQRTIARRQKAADFRQIRSLDNFDFAFNPSIDRARIYELAAVTLSENSATRSLLVRPGSEKAIWLKPSESKPSKPASWCSTARCSTWCVSFPPRPAKLARAAC